VKNVSPIATQQYIEKADHFFHGMELLSGDITAYRTSIGLLAIHSAILLSDAITVGLTGKKERYQEHAQAAKTLTSLCGSHKISNKQGIEHLRWLLAQKNTVAYKERRFDDASVRLAVDKAGKFYAWAYYYFEEALRGI
jgi:hypothetical protein